MPIVLLRDDDTDADAGLPAPAKLVKQVVAARLPENTQNTNDKEKSFRFAFCALRARRIWEKPTLSRGRERVAVMANAKAEWVRSVEPRVRRIRDRGPRAGDR